LKLSTSEQDSEKVFKFIKIAKGRKVDEIEQIAIKMSEQAGTKDEAWVNIIVRALKYLKKEGGFKPELAGTLGLGIERYPEPHVVNHEGRARALLAMLQGITSLKCDTYINRATSTSIMRDTSIQYIAGQAFGKLPRNYIKKEEVFEDSLKHTSASPEDSNEQQYRFMIKDSGVMGQIAYPKKSIVNFLKNSPAYFNNKNVLKVKSGKKVYSDNIEDFEIVDPKSLT
jgi:hypothetical protein